MSKAIEYIHDIDIYKYLDNFSELKKKAIYLSNTAGNTDQKEAFYAHPSFITTRNASEHVKNCLVIDIGGTSTKVAIRTINNNVISWDFLFETNNKDIYIEQDNTHSCKLFFKLLTKKIKELLPLELTSLSIGLVWSNSIKNEVTNRGIEGYVCNRNNYRKNEWFIKDLKDNDNVSEFLIEAFNNESLSVKTILIANDTVLTLKATKNADSGMVASTGLNTTIIKTDSNQSTICNSESGGTFLVGDIIATKSDKIESFKKANTIENYTSGLFLPQLFTNYILDSADKVSELKDLKKYLSLLGDNIWSEYNTQDMALILYDKKSFLENKPNKKDYNDDALFALEIFAQELFIRSAKLTALVTFSSIANILESKDQFLISIDSSLIREVPIFKEEFAGQLAELIPEGKRVDIVLVRPIQTKNGVVSVPMIGASNAVDSLI